MGGAGHAPFALPQLRAATPRSRHASPPSLTRARSATTSTTITTRPSPRRCWRWPRRRRARPRSTSRAARASSRSAPRRRWGRAAASSASTCLQACLRGCGGGRRRRPRGTGFGLDGRAGRTAVRARGERCAFGVAPPLAAAAPPRKRALLAPAPPARRAPRRTRRACRPGWSGCTATRKTTAAQPAAPARRSAACWTREALTSSRAPPRCPSFGTCPRRSRGGARGCGRRPAGGWAHRCARVCASRTILEAPTRAGLACSRETGPSKSAASRAGAARWVGCRRLRVQQRLRIAAAAPDPPTLPHAGARFPPGSRSTALWRQQVNLALAGPCIAGHALACGSKNAAWAPAGGAALLTRP